MAWTAPATWVSGAILTAAQLNTQLRDNMLNLRALANVQQHYLSAASGPTSLATNTDSAAILSASITPTANTSKVLVTYTLNVDSASGQVMWGRLYRAGTLIGAGDVVGSRISVNAMTTTSGNDWIGCINFVYLDSPATASATTYEVKVRHWSSLTRDYYVNRTVTDTNNNLYPRTASVLTLQEIPA